MAESEEKPYAPSARRLEQAREEGNVLFSREAISAAMLLVAVLMMVAFVPASAARQGAILRGLMLHAGDGDLSPQLAMRVSLRAALTFFLPFGGAVVTFALAIGLLQTGFLFRLSALAPDPGRLSPMKGLSRILGASALMDALKSIGKCAAFGAIMFWQARSLLHESASLIGYSLPILLARLMHAIVRVGAALLCAQIVFAGIDILWNWQRRVSKLRMTLQEVKEEYRQMEGDPHIKGKLKQMRARLARQRMMEAVKTATVVVTNPTHYAVALMYDQKSPSAPRIVAKGVDDVAARIRDLARRNNVPIMPNPPLARALFPLPLDTEIPIEHFRIVAAIIAQVWRIKRGMNR